MKKVNEDQTEELKQQVDEWKTKYLRALADYQNLNRRTHDEIHEVRKFASEVLLIQLLPVVDTFQKAKEHLKDPGFDLALKQLSDFLVRQGVAKIEVIGKAFNPHEMECIEVVKSDKDGIVAEEIRDGYTLGDKILRVAQVKVGKKEADEKAEKIVKDELTKGDYK